MMRLSLVRQHLPWQTNREDYQRTLRNLAMLLMDLKLRRKNVICTIPIIREILHKEMENWLSWSKLLRSLHPDSQD